MSQLEQSLAMEAVGDVRVAVQEMSVIVAVRFFVSAMTTAIIEQNSEVMLFGRLHPIVRNSTCPRLFATHEK
jgi:hypothetical protein